MSKLPYRTASTSTTGVKKNVKQILTLERERVSGGDGFLTASQTAARARGEVVEPAGSKKKKTGPGAGGGGVNNLPNKRGFNLKNRKSGGTNTPLTQDGVLESGQTTPNTGNNGDDDGEGEDEEEEGADQAVKGDLELNIPHKEVITCESNTSVSEICTHLVFSCRPHAGRAAQSTPREEVLRHYRSSCELHRSKDEAAVQRS